MAEQVIHRSLVTLIVEDSSIGHDYSAD
jgi:hypothetical protein